MSVKTVIDNRRDLDKSVSGYHEDFDTAFADFRAYVHDKAALIAADLGKQLETAIRNGDHQQGLEIIEAMQALSYASFVGGAKFSQYDPDKTKIVKLCDMNGIVVIASFNVKG